MPVLLADDALRFAYSEPALRGGRPNLAHLIREAEAVAGPSTRLVYVIRCQRAGVAVGIRAGARPRGDRR